MLNHLNKKIWCLLLAFCLFRPSISQAKARDYVMALPGAVFIGAGITLVIKSGKTKPDADKSSKLEIKTWNPNTQPIETYDPLRH